MIDIVRFDVGMDDWIKGLGFKEFVNYKNLNVVIGGDGEKHLSVLRRRNVDVLVSCEMVKRKDNLHFRCSGLNQVLMNLAKKNGIAIGFCFSNILGDERAVILGRMMQNVRLCRKYKVKMVLCSFARDKWGLRNASDLKSFGRVIGMTGEEVNFALNFKRSVKGVRILK